ncbi:MAG TPA: sulfotransferase [Terriglobales bacterium]|nr:sulfotransferase [Terriglobales bacterium]
MGDANKHLQFLCIGAQKAGTTWLYENLKHQPGIWLPPVKEIHYFDHRRPSTWKRLTSEATHHKGARQHLFDCLRDVTKGKKKPNDLSLAWHIALGDRDDAWYDKLFSWSDRQIAGEICPGYARLSAERIEALARRYPHLKIIYMLRDPVDRAWSSVAMHYRKNSDDLVTSKAEDQIIGKLLQWKRFGHCSYMRNIENWTRFFPREQIYFGFFDRLAGDPSGLLSEILAFLGVDAPVASAQIEKAVNAGRGERISRNVEKRLSALLLGETEDLHNRIGNDYTARWLQHVKSVLTPPSADSPAAE